MSFRGRLTLFFLLIVVLPMIAVAVLVVQVTGSSRSGKADARVRQNLGLVVGLQGRFAEAESIVKADLPPDEAASNVAYLKQMLSRKDNRRAGAMPVASLDRPD